MKSTERVHIGHRDYYKTPFKKVGITLMNGKKIRSMTKFFRFLSIGTSRLKCTLCVFKKESLIRRVRKLPADNSVKLRSNNIEAAQPNLPSLQSPYYNNTSYAYVFKNNEHRFDIRELSTDQEKKRAVNIILGNFENHEIWNTKASKIVQNVVIQLPGWPAEKNSMIKNLSTDNRDFFYSSILAKLSDTEKDILLGSDFREKEQEANIRALHERCLTLLQEQPSLIDDFLIKQRIYSKEVVEEAQQRIVRLTVVQAEENKQAIDLLLKGIRRNGTWNDMSGEIVANIITLLPSWPSKRSLEINGRLNDAGTAQDKMPVRLKLEGNHYSPIIGGELKSVPGDGNCFYHSILDSLTEYEQKVLLNGHFVENDQTANIISLRNLCADYLQQSPSLLFPVAAAMQLSEGQKTHFTASKKANITQLKAIVH